MTPRTAEVTVDEDLTDTVALPDPERARAVWGKLGPMLAGAERICGGIDVARSIDADAAARMDMESRWDLFLRARYLNTWHGLPAQLEVLAPRA